MTSFKAMTECTIGIVNLLRGREDDRYLSYLPVSHGMERWLGEVSEAIHDLVMSFLGTLQEFPLFATTISASHCTQGFISTLRNHSRRLWLILTGVVRPCSYLFPACGRSSKRESSKRCQSRLLASF